MNFEDITVKRFLTNDEFNRYVVLVAQNYFDEETGVYTPYAARSVLIYGFAKYCLIGIPESVSYEEIMNSQQIRTLFSENANSSIVSEVREMAKDMAEFEKKKRLQAYSPVANLFVQYLEKEIEKKNQEIALSKAATEMNIAQKRLNNEQARALEYQNKVNEQFTPEEQASLIRKMDDTDMDMDKWTESLIDKLSDKLYESDYKGEKMGEILDVKNAKIRELKQYKDAHDARNVLNDNK